MRILIAGGPKVGKTTLSRQLNMQFPSLTVHHGDDLIGTLEWSEASEEISKWFDRDGDWLIEGVQVARALRKWLDRNNFVGPADVIYYRAQPHIELTKGQSAMSKGCISVWREIVPELERRGVRIETF